MQDFCIICSSLNIYREAKIARENTNAPVRDDDGPRINEDIRVKEVRLIDENGENRGVVSIREALQIAADAGLDLIEISPQAVPPVCKVLDYGKYKYEAQKRKAEAKKNQKVIEIKELKLRPMIDKHDYEVKVKQAKRFLDEGNKVKFTVIKAASSVPTIWEKRFLTACWKIWKDFAKSIPLPSLKANKWWWLFRRKNKRDSQNKPNGNFNRVSVFLFYKTSDSHIKADSLLHKSSFMIETHSDTTYIKHQTNKVKKDSSCLIKTYQN